MDVVEESAAGEFAYVGARATGFARFETGFARFETIATSIFAEFVNAHVIAEMPTWRGKNEIAPWRSARYMVAFYVTLFAVWQSNVFCAVFSSIYRWLCTQNKTIMDTKADPPQAPSVAVAPVSLDAICDKFDDIAWLPNKITEWVHKGVVDPVVHALRILGTKHKRDVLRKLETAIHEAIL